MFDKIPALESMKKASLAPTTRGIDTYLAAPCEKVEGSVLDWWNARRDMYGPGMRRMAISYLTAPGTSFHYWHHGDIPTAF